MEEKVKQRLIGVLVIVGALFIILPFLFHNSRPTLSQNAPSNTSNQPNNPSVSVSLPAAASTTTETTTPVTTAESATPAQNTQAQNVQNGQQPVTANTAANNAAPAAATPTTTPSVAVNTVSTPAAPSAVNTTQQTIQTAQNTQNTVAITPAPAVAPTPATKTVAAKTAKKSVSAPAPVANTAPANVTVADNTAAAAPAATLPSTTFSGTQATSNALTTGQANEGPTQTATQASAAMIKNTAVASSTPSVADNTTTATYKPVHRNHVVHAAVEKKEVRSVSHVEKSKFVSRPVVGSWVVQLGAFSDKANATHLISKLRAHQFEAYTHTVRHNEKTIMVVFVGPEASMQKAESMQRQLRERFQLNGVVKKA